MSFYQLEKVNDRILAIRSLQGEYVFLILGEKRALLIDTCTGIGNLRAYVESLTDLPITVALTHGHIDHAMGAPEFDQVYLNLADLPIYKKQCSKEERLGYLHAGLSDEQLAPYLDSLLEAEPDYPFLSLEDGHIFDLGGVHVSVHAFAGHTPGMMAFLVEEEELLILGDACNNSTFLFDDSASDVESYLGELQKVRQLFEGKFKRIFISHMEKDVSIDIMDNMVEICDDIMNDEADDLPFTFMGMKAYIAKNCDNHFRRRDGKDGNLIYSKSKIFASQEGKA